MTTNPREYWIRQERIEARLSEACGRIERTLDKMGRMWENKEFLEQQPYYREAMYRWQERCAEQVRDSMLMKSTYCIDPDHWKQVKKDVERWKQDKQDKQRKQDKEDAERLAIHKVLVNSKKPYKKVWEIDNYRRDPEHVAYWCARTAIEYLQTLVNFSSWWSHVSVKRQGEIKQEMADYMKGSIAPVPKVLLLEKPDWERTAWVPYCLWTGCVIRISGFKVEVPLEALKQECERREHSIFSIGSTWTNVEWDELLVLRKAYDEALRTKP